MPEARQLALFGSTGSIGSQTLDVARRIGGFEIALLTAGSRWEVLAQQAREYAVPEVVLGDAGHYDDLMQALVGTGCRVHCGRDALVKAAAEADYDVALNALVGISGLPVSHEALKRGKTLALANKESLVLAGDLLMRIAIECDGQILPVDSEHSAIFQCLAGESMASVRRLILTASGGPFRDWSSERISTASPEEALAHPNWKMGPKITIDSATLINKGLEIIEACHLFGLPHERVYVRIHRPSVVHSLVEFTDGSLKAQLGKPDMRLPIQFALTWPERQPADYVCDDPLEWPTLTFETLDGSRFPGPGLARVALTMGGTATAVMNGADEAAVAHFLSRRIAFGSITDLIEQALNQHTPLPADSLEAVIAADAEGRDFVNNRVAAS